MHALGALPGVRLRDVSRLYASAPVGLIDQPEFRNAVAALDVPTADDAVVGALDLLVALKGIERDFGRQRRARWGPREVDLDLLVFGRASLSIARPPAGRSIDAAVQPDKRIRLLVVPHPEAHERLFVLAPLADLAPRLVPPGWGETVGAAMRRREAVEGGDVRVVGEWDRAAGAWTADERGFGDPSIGDSRSWRRR